MWRSFCCIVLASATLHSICSPASPEPPNQLCLQVRGPYKKGACTMNTSVRRPLSLHIDVHTSQHDEQRGTCATAVVFFPCTSTALPTAVGAERRAFATGRKLFIAGCWWDNRARANAWRGKSRVLNIYRLVPWSTPSARTKDQRSPAFPWSERTRGKVHPGRHYVFFMRSCGARKKENEAFAL